MSRKQNFFIWIPLVLVALVTTGCPKKQVTPPAAPIVEAPVEEVAPVEIETPAPPQVVDEVDPYVGGDFEKMTMTAYQDGSLGDVYFSYDRYDLEGSSRDRLSKNAEFMRAHPDLMIRVEGHCDERGTNEYNLALGERRASGAKGYISSLGVDGSRMTTVSYGEESSLCNESSETCWRRNRRAAFKVVGRR